MSFAVMAVLLPMLGAPLLGCLGAPLAGARANLTLSAAVFLLTTVGGYAPGLGLIRADPLGIVFGMLTGFVGLTTAIGNLAFVRAGIETMSLRQWRLYHALFQLIVGLALLGLYADNIGVLWVAMEGAMLAAAAGVGLTGAAPARRAAWRVLLLGGVGLMLALFGTLLIYLAAQPALGPGWAAMSFAGLNQSAARLDGGLMALAFVLLLFGYGAQAALMPLHGWWPDAVAEGPAPLNTTLGMLRGNVALLAILRFRHLAGACAAGHGLPPAPFLLAIGLASLLFAGLALARRRDARRFFGLAAIGQSGIVVFAFGVGGAAAIFGGLLHMILHTLIKTGLFQALTQGAVWRGGAGQGAFGFNRLRGMAATNKLLGWLLGGAVFALCGLPPSGLFVAEYLIVSQTVRRLPLLAILLGLGLVLFAVAVLRTVKPLVLGPAPAGAAPQPGGGAGLPVAVHLLLAVVLGFAMPAALLATLSAAALALQ